MDLGFVCPDADHRWNWPFKEMEDGDSFKVSPDMREFQRVRTLAYNRANQLNRARQYTVRKDEFGNAVVTRTVRRGLLPRRTAVVLYGDARMMLAEYPGADLDDLPVHALGYGETYRFNGCRIHSPPEYPWMVVQLHDGRIGITQEADGFTVEGVGDRDTFETFAQRKMLLS